MDTQPTSTSDGSVMLWLLGALVLLLGSHILLGWIRQAMDLSGAARLRAALIGSATFGTSLSVGIALGLAGESLSFSFGYYAVGAFAVWLGAMVLTLPAALLPALRRDGGFTAAAGFLLAVVVTGVEAAWVVAVGFRPGPAWHPGYLVLALLVTSLGFGTAMVLAFPRPEWARNYRYSWRLSAAGLMGLSFLLGYSLVLGAANLPLQVGSIYRSEIPGTTLAILAGATLPLVLSIMAVDLEVRRGQRRRDLRARRRTSASEAVNTMMFELQPEEIEALNASLRALPSPLVIPTEAAGTADAGAEQAPPMRPAT